MLSHKARHNLKVGLGVLSGSTLGYIAGNVPGAIIGGKLAYNYLK